MIDLYDRTRRFHEIASGPNRTTAGLRRRQCRAVSLDPEIYWQLKAPACGKCSLRDDLQKPSE
jgi:hypothetical protein